MKVLNTASVASVFLALSACVPPPAIRDDQSAVVGISMHVAAPVRLFRYRPDRVYFVTAEKKEELCSRGRLVASNYVKGDRAYLLNASPGHYVAVAAYYKNESNQKTSHYTTYFTRAVVERTLVRIDPGALVFMGDYTVNQDTDLTHPDDVQMCFMPLVDPTALLKLGGTEEAIMAGLASGLAGGFSYSGVLGEVVQDKGTEATFLEKSLDDLREGGWAGVVQRRIEAVRLKQ